MSKHQLQRSPIRLEGRASFVSHLSLASAVPRVRAQRRRERAGAGRIAPRKSATPRPALMSCSRSWAKGLRSCLASEDALAGPQPPRSLAGPRLRPSARRQRSTPTTTRRSRVRPRLITRGPSFSAASPSVLKFRTKSPLLTRPMIFFHSMWLRLSQRDGAYGLRLLSKARQNSRPTAISDVMESARLTHRRLSFADTCEGLRLKTRLASPVEFV